MTEDAAHIRLRNLEDQLILCQRQYALNSLAPAIVHEFNNLMTPVLARAQDALDRNDEAARRRALEVTVNQIQRAINITRRLVELAAGESLHVDSCCLTTAVNNAHAALVRPLAKDGIEFEMALDAGLRVAAEPLMLEQFFVTLLVELRGLLEHSTGRIRVSAAENGDGRTRIRIAARGAGIAPQAAAAAVQAILSVGLADDGDWRRIGVGLSVARYISRRHAASIAVEQPAPDGLEIGVHWPTATGSVVASAQPILAPLSQGVRSRAS